ncbi:MAG: DUF4382 domain-containing protein [Sphingobacteriales bacterium]|nr:DUF4382 domain-containing protein [Sphingobacteriales bacterium]
MIRKIVWPLMLALTLAVVVGACSKSDKPDGSKARLQIYLTDDPGDYEAVFVDVQDVQINVTNDADNGWQSLDGVRRGSYDLLTLVNDQDTLLAEADIPSGRIHQIRLVLGTENYVKINGELKPLTTPSAQQSGLKLNFQQDVQAGLLYKVTLDFDVAKSIVETGSGKFMLKPVIRGILESVGGSIKGAVVPADSPTLVMALNGTDTVATTFTGLSGGYILKGLPSATYSLHFQPGNLALGDTTLTGITVNAGAVTTVDTLHILP